MGRGRGPETNKILEGFLATKTGKWGSRPRWGAKTVTPLWITEPCPTGESWGSLMEEGLENWKRKNKEM